jgi:DNA ligase-associated metallophosphoesterase
MNHNAIRLHGVEMKLFAERAALLVKKKWLLVADAHFGKGENFRQTGMPVPVGTTKTDFAILSRLIEITDAGTVVFLGDLVHSKPPSGSDLLKTMKDWRDRHLKIKLLAVEGNHDKNADKAFEAIGITEIHQRLTTESLILAHEPIDTDSEKQPSYLLAGHVHPVLRVPGLKNHREALPCYYFGKRYGLLPAFGSFTGGGRIFPTPGDVVFLCADNEIFSMVNR